MYVRKSLAPVGYMNICTAVTSTLISTLKVDWFQIVSDNNSMFPFEESQTLNASSASSNFLFEDSSSPGNSKVD